VGATSLDGTRVWRRLTGISRIGVALLDVLIPAKRGIVVRTMPDFDDQGLAMVAALADAGLGPVTWLCVDAQSTNPSAVTPALPDTTRVVRARSARGVWAYVRARAVVHTHGVYEAPRRSRRKVFVNVWHGMPVKRLDSRPLIAVRQTDVFTATSEVHAEHMTQSWGLARDQIALTGLPRNDRMLRASSSPRPLELEEVTQGSPLVLWLPTYRQSVTGDIRLDGHEFGNDFEFPGADAQTVSALARRCGVHVIAKLHPMSPVGRLGEYDGLSVWDESSLRAHGLTLYELLGHADVLVTDHSSVWVDFLLLDRPVVFSIADLAEYSRTRGHYFQPLAEHLPGPVVTDLPGLEECLLESLAGSPVWSRRRSELRPVHHAHVDDLSAARVAELVGDRL
jgi:CDP-glycerol glycerophosphotransferase (TagB/SpsB family)